MRAVSIPEFTDPATLKVIETPEPEPAAGWAILDLVAADVSPLDRQIATGQLPGAGPLPIQPGANAVGRITASGTHEPGVLAFVAGGVAGMGNSSQGAMATVIVAPDRAIFPLPDGADPLAIAAGTGGGISALAALVDHAGLRQGETVLVLGATGAVGRAACQIASSQGAVVLAGARDPSKLGDLDATPIDIDQMPAAVMEATGGKGADVIIDGIGGDYLNPAVLSGSAGCRHVLIGYMAGKTTNFTIPLVMIRQHKLLGFNANQLPPERHGSVVSEVIEDIAGGPIRPLIRDTVPLDDVRKAYAASGGGGRVLVVP